MDRMEGMEQDVRRTPLPVGVEEEGAFGFPSP